MHVKDHHDETESECKTRQIKQKLPINTDLITQQLLLTLNRLH